MGKTIDYSITIPKSFKGIGQAKSKLLTVDYKKCFLRKNGLSKKNKKNDTQC